MCSCTEHRQMCFRYVNSQSIPHKKIVQFLVLCMQFSLACALLHGINLPTCPSQSGLTALSWASRNGCTAIVNLLLEAGADMETKNNVRDWKILHRNLNVIAPTLYALCASAFSIRGRGGWLRGLISLFPHQP